MRRHSSCIKAAFIVATAVLVLGTFAHAQESVTGSVTFSRSGVSQSNSAFWISGHTSSCAQNPVWRRTDIKNGSNPTIVNTLLFGPCVIDGVPVRQVTLFQAKSGLLLTIDMSNGTSWSLLLVNSAGVRLTDLTDIGSKGAYAANSFVGFDLIGSCQ